MAVVTITAMAAYINAKKAFATIRATFCLNAPCITCNCSMKCKLQNPPPCRRHRGREARLRATLDGIILTGWNLNGPSPGTSFLELPQSPRVSPSSAQVPSVSPSSAQVPSNTFPGRTVSLRHIAQIPFFHSGYQLNGCPRKKKIEKICSIPHVFTIFVSSSHSPQASFTRLKIPLQDVLFHYDTVSQLLWPRLLEFCFK